MYVSAILVYCIINTIAEMQVAAFTYILLPTSSFYPGGGATYHIYTPRTEYIVECLLTLFVFTFSYP